MKTPTIVVAYSGGLDTSVMVRWLIEKYNATIITTTGDLGQQKELVGVEEKALRTSTPICSTQAATAFRIFGCGAWRRKGSSNRWWPSGPYP